MLTNVMLYWFTGTAGSSANLYYEADHDRSLGPKAARRTVPTGVAVFAAGHRHPALAERDTQHRPLVGVRPRRPLRRDGGARPARRRRARRSSAAAYFSSS